VDNKGSRRFGSSDLSAQIWLKASGCRLPSAVSRLTSYVLHRTSYIVRPWRSAGGRSTLRPKIDLTQVPGFQPSFYLLCNVEVVGTIRKARLTNLLYAILQNSHARAGVCFSQPIKRLHLLSPRSTVLASGKQCSTSPPYVELCQNSKAVKNPSHSVGLRFFIFFVAANTRDGMTDIAMLTHDKQRNESISSEVGSHLGCRSLND
jgi:hypothetical protein